MDLERPINLIISKNGLSLPALNINELLMGAAQETLYVFLLLYRGIQFNQIKTLDNSGNSLTPWNFEFMTKLYMELTGRDLNPVVTMLTSANHFATYRANINNNLKRQLPAGFLDLFTIGSNANYNRIKLDRSLITIDPDSKKLRNLIIGFRKALRVNQSDGRLHADF